MTVRKGFTFIELSVVIIILAFSAPLNRLDSLNI